MKEEYDDRKVIISEKIANEISKILSSSSVVDIYFPTCSVEFDDTVVVTRLIEGEYYRMIRCFLQIMKQGKYK